MRHGYRPDALMLFAAGFGSRMRPLTENCPKPLIRVADRTLLDHALDLAKGMDLSRIVGNAHHLAGQMAQALRERAISVSLEKPDILDTGGGLKAALPLLDRDQVFALNTDAVWTGRDQMSRLAEAWDPERMGALLYLVRPEDARGHLGACDFEIGPEGRLRRAPGHIYTGLQIVSADPVRRIPDRAFSLNRVWDRLIAEGRLFGILHEGLWCDVGRPECIPLAEAMLAEMANS